MNFDELKDKAKDLLTGHGDKVEEGADRARQLLAPGRFNSKGELDDHRDRKRIRARPRGTVQRVENRDHVRANVRGRL